MIERQIIAVVVTYNRLNLLKNVISALKRQTKKVDRILIINNGSTDGTGDWLEKQDNIMVITQENIGGSGGFYRGIKEAYELKADYVWCMDDDVYPFDDCLEQMLIAMPSTGGIVSPQRLYNGIERVYGGECKHFNFSNPFKPLKSDLSVHDLNGNTEYVNVEAIAFEGPLFSRDVIASIGFPEKDLFIFWDDTEYSYRAFRAGFLVRYAIKARFFKEDLRSKITDLDKRSWKYPYMIRNEVFFINRYGSLFFKYVYIIKVLFRYIAGIVKHLFKNDKKYVGGDIFVVLRSVIDGMTCKLKKY